MKMAIDLSRQAAEADAGGPFAAIIVKDDIVIATGRNEVMARGDPTAHAEIVSIRDACAVLKSFDLTGCVIYTNCEPCPMCLGAIYWARLDRIYYANSRCDAADIGFQDQFLYEEMGRLPAERRIPLEQLAHEEARLVFNEWRSKPGRRLY